jgi:hypothetical protein
MHRRSLAVDEWSKNRNRKMHKRSTTTHPFLRVWLIGACAAFLISGCAVRLAKMTDVQKAELLATERGRLSDIQDPVARTKTYITISRILLDFVAGAARDGDAAELNSLLNQYVSAIRDARDTMVNSDRDPLRRPGGYKDLEIILREHTRRLRDIANSLTFDERRPIEVALEEADAIRQEMLRLLFPQTPGLTELRKHVQL